MTWRRGLSPAERAALDAAAAARVIDARPNDAAAAAEQPALPGFDQAGRRPPRFRSDPQEGRRR